MHEIINNYRYYNASGELSYEVCRFKNKDFRIRVPDENGNYLWGLNGKEKLPYRLPEILKSPAVVIVEGEKDADRLSGLGIAATCNPFGAMNWQEGFGKWFQDKDIIILPDNDDPGLKHAYDVAEKLIAFARSIKIVQLPNLPPKGDVSDYLDQGHTIDEIAEIAGQTECFFLDKKKLEPPIRTSPNNYNSNNENQIREIIIDLNKQYAVIWVGGKLYVLKEITDPISNQSDFIFVSTQDFHTYYANKTIFVPSGPKSSKPVTLSKLWIESPLRREYEGIIFDPNYSGSYYFNLYNGLNIHPKKGDWSLFKQHILKIISNDNETIFEWLIAWMARIVQNPGGKRPGTAPVLRGKQGTGKGFFVNTFGKIFGKHFIQITNQSQLTGKFNTHLKDKLLVFVDEGFWAGDKSSEGVLKGLITEDKIIVEPKGKDPFSVRNYMNIIMATNNQWAVPAGLEERRFMVVDVSDDKIQDKNYFKKVYHQMKNGGLSAMLFDLMHHDISDVDLRTIPRTEALFDQIQCTMSPIKRFWFEKLDSGYLDYPEKWPRYVSRAALYNMYLDFSNSLHLRHPTERSRFFKELYAICPNETGKSLRRVEGKGKRQWYIKLPSLDSCRTFFESIVQMKINWSDLNYVEIDEREQNNPFRQNFGSP